MRVTLLLADYAQSDNRGKVHAIGLGWTTITTPLPPFAVVIILDIDWSETNHPHRVTCELLTDDGQPVKVQGPVGAQPLRFEMQVEAGRPPGTIHGTALRSPLSVNVGGGVPLTPGRYQWRASVEGFDEATTTESFLVQAAPNAPVAAQD
ncbi:hypothetical protein MyChFU_31380 [Mycobacterium intracellulare subsp. chimaera]